MPTTRSCGQCGATWPVTASFCGTCGAHLDEVSGAPTRRVTVSPRTAMLLGLVVVVVIVGVAGWQALRRPADVGGDAVAVLDVDPRAPEDTAGFPPCLVGEQERRCVTWHLEESLRDAAPVGSRLVVLTTNGTIAGVDPASGAVDWATRTGLFEAFLITGPSPDRVLVRRDDTLLLFDTVAGIRLSRHTGDFVALDADHLVVRTPKTTEDADQILVVDSRTGQELASWPLSPSSDVKIRGLGHHLVVEDTGRILALDVRDGATMWERQLADLRVRTVGPEGILLQADEAVTAVDAASGAERWTVPFDGILSAWHVLGADSMTAATGRDASFELVHFDAATGREVWRTSITDPDRPNDTRVLPGAVALRWADDQGLIDRLEYAPIPGEGYLLTRSFAFPPSTMGNARIVRIDPLVVATDDGLYGLDAASLQP